MFFVPAVTMRAFAVEKREGTLEILLTHPIKEIDLLAGKLFGNTLLIVIALVLTLTIPISLLLGGRPDMGVVFAQYLGAILLIISFVSIGLFTSSFTENQTIAFIVSILINFVLIISGIEFVTTALPYPVDLIFSNISILSHFQNITRGVIDVRDVIYFSAISVSMLSLTYLLILKRKINRASQSYRNLKIGVTLIILISIVSSLFVNYINIRLDLTSENVYSLSPATRTLVRNLNDIVTIKLYASAKLPAKAELSLRDVRDTLNDFKTSSGGKIKLSVINPDANQEAKFEAQMAGIQPVNFNVISQDEFQTKQGYMGLVVNFANKKELIPFIGQLDDFEYRLASLIRKVTTNERKKIAFLTGHEENSSQEGVQALSGELSKQYDVGDFTINEGDKTSKLKKYNSIIIAGPKKWIPTYAQKILSEYVKEGGSLFALIDGVSVDTNSSNAARNMNGTMKIFLKELGVTVNTNLLYDLKSNESVPFGGGPVNYILPYPFWLKTQIRSSETSKAILGDVNSVSLPWASSINIDKKATKGIKINTLFSTSTFAGQQKDKYNILPRDNPEIKQAALASFPVAVSLMNKEGGRAIMVGDSEFIHDNYVGNYQENLIFALNSMDWLTQDESLIGIRAKNITTRRLLFSSDFVKSFIRYFNMVGMPLIVALFGAVRLIRRRQTTKRVYSV